MAKAVSAIELSKEVSANPRTFRYYLARNWGERQKYQRWLFTRAQADKIKAAYVASTKYRGKRGITSPKIYHAGCSTTETQTYKLMTMSLKISNINQTKKDNQDQLISDSKTQLVLWACVPHPPNVCFR